MLQAADVNTTLCELVCTKCRCDYDITCIDVGKLLLTALNGLECE